MAGQVLRVFGQAWENCARSKAILPERHEQHKSSGQGTGRPAAVTGRRRRPGCQGKGNVRAGAYPVGSTRRRRGATGAAYAPRWNACRRPSVAKRATAVVCCRRVSGSEPPRGGACRAAVRPQARQALLCTAGTMTALRHQCPESPPEGSAEGATPQASGVCQRTTRRQRAAAAASVGRRRRRAVLSPIFRCPARARRAHGVYPVE